jgi:predicted MPP superfamily phosphohydrolase
MPLLVLKALVPFVLLILLFMGNNRVEESVYELKSSKLPLSFDGFCIVQISDLHNHAFGPYQPRFLQMIRDARPDLIAITGDLINAGKGRPGNALELVRQLTAIAPCNFVTGNNEVQYDQLSALLEQLGAAGVKVLRGESVVWNRGTDSLVIAGIDDPKMFRTSEMSIPEAVARWEKELIGLRASIGPEYFTVLLSHRPEHILRYARLGFDVVLSGHAHGGQVRLPFVGALYAPNQGFRPRYTSGMYQNRETTLVVSRGLGQSTFPLRVFNRPEIVTLRLSRQ